MFSFVEKHSYSVRSQMISPKKVYAADTGLAYALSTHAMTDEGHLLENLVYIALRNHHSQILYFDGVGECDFVILHNDTSVINLKKYNRVLAKFRLTACKS